MERQMYQNAKEAMWKEVAHVAPLPSLSVLKAQLCFGLDPPYLGPCLQHSWHGLPHRRPWDLRPVGGCGHEDLSLSYYNHVSPVCIQPFTDVDPYMVLVAVLVPG